MKIRIYTITLAVATAATFGTQVAQAHLLVNDGSYASVGSTSQATVNAMQVAGVDFHATAKGVRALKATRSAVRPDDRPGPRL